MKVFRPQPYIGLCLQLMFSGFKVGKAHRKIHVMVKEEARRRDIRKTINETLDIRFSRQRV
jgi:hypothetical protein